MAVSGHNPSTASMTMSISVRDVGTVAEHDPGKIGWSPGHDPDQWILEPDQVDGWTSTSDTQQGPGVVEDD
jgi:hypothetical protein